MSLIMIGCGASAASSARMLDRNLHRGVIQLEGDDEGSMAQAESLMERHCGPRYTIDGVSAAGRLAYHCASQRDIYGELPPVLAKNAHH